MIPNHHTTHALLCVFTYVKIPVLDFSQFKLIEALMDDTKNMALAT
jgi:hypothetical protein